MFLAEDGGNDPHALSAPPVFKTGVRPLRLHPPLFLRPARHPPRYTFIKVEYITIYELNIGSFNSTKYSYPPGISDIGT